MHISISKDGQELLIHVPIHVTRKIFMPSIKNEAGQLDVTRLTVRERQVLEGLTTGKVSKEIASDLNLSLRTVKYHLGSIYKKFQVTGAKELLFMA